MKLAMRKLRLKKLMVKRAKRTKNMGDYHNQKAHLRTMRRSWKYLTSELIMYESLAMSMYVVELNTITRIALNDDLYKQVIKDLKQQIKGGVTYEIQD